MVRSQRQRRCPLAVGAGRMSDEVSNDHGAKGRQNFGAERRTTVSTPSIGGKAWLTKFARISQI